MDSETFGDILNYTTGQYYKAVQEGLVISFDSGEESDRRKYISSTLEYLQNIKGIPCMVLSSLNAKVTKTFLNRIPYTTKSKLLNIGLFHTYLQVIENFRKLLDLLFISREYRSYMEMFFCAIRAIETDLIKEINKLNILCILDRSIISNYLYYKAITLNSPNAPNWPSLFDLNDFKPLNAFYVHSEQTTEKFIHGSMYDSEIGINYTLRGILPQIKNLIPNLVELESYNTFEQNMKLIKETLKL